MATSLIAVIDFALKHSLHKQTVFKVLKRLEIETRSLKGSQTSRGQRIAYMTEADAERVLSELQSRSPGTPKDDSITSEAGLFYVIQLEPEHDPSRFKVGYASNLSERIRHLRTSAPLLKVQRTWPCKRLWEKTAIECVTLGCVRLHTEVFRTSSLQSVIERCNAFFSLMPEL
jgi:hypothetical protein